MPRMFDVGSFDSLENASEAKASVQYLAKNELKFEKELSTGGMGYDAIQTEVKMVWLGLLKVCARYKYSDYIVSSKKAMYGIK